MTRLRVAWVTHHLMDGRSGPGLLPGTVGGAEMTDEAMIAAAPQDVQVTVIPASEWADALSFARIVVTGTDMLSETAMMQLAERRPLVWVHHKQQYSPARQRLFEQADPFLTMSELHSRYEESTFGVASDWVHGAFDVRMVRPAERKSRVALWAARDHPQKGLVKARLWAHTHQMPLVEMTGQPHHLVLEQMARSETFVFLPASLDACPRTLIEAELAGCEIVTNSHAGRRDAGDLSACLAAQIRKFWSWVG